jgi:RNA polymerase sigma-70 factor (ECF subfamily)
MKIDENNFVLELKKHNKKALDFLFNNYKRLVYKVVLSVLKDRSSEQDIEECVADVFIAVWKNIDKYDASITGFKKWLVSICKYKSIDYLRKESIRPITSNLDEQLGDPFENIELTMIQKENFKALRSLIDSMNEIDKQIFVKKYLLDEKTIDIANSLSLSRSIVDNRLSRGRKTLRQKWIEIVGGGINE